MTKYKDILKSTIKYGCIVIIVLGFIYGIYSLFKSFSDVPNYVAPESGVTKDFVSNVLKTEGVDNVKSNSQIIYKEIEKIKEVEKPPTYYAPVGTPEKDIKDILKKDGGDLAITENNANTKPGTNIYSIHLDKSKHGIGVYAGTKIDPGSVSTAYGVHYRNNRWVYQVGVDTKGGLDARIAYEAIQW